MPDDCPTFRVLAVFVSVIFQRYMSWPVGPSVWWGHPAALAEVRIMFPAPCVAVETVFFGSYSALLPNTADWVDAEKLSVQPIKISTYHRVKDCYMMLLVETVAFGELYTVLIQWIKDFPKPWTMKRKTKRPFLHLVCCFSVAPRCQANEVE